MQSHAKYEKSGFARAEKMTTGTPLLSHLDARIEALLFAAGRPVAVGEIEGLLPSGVDVASALRRIQEFWSGRGITLEKTSDGWLMRAETSLLPEDAPLTVRRLSEAAIATLAVVAMHQPVTLSQIEKTRGVKLARGIMESLLRAGLVTEEGRLPGTGGAALYGVTEKFLERFDLESLADLPTAEEAFLLDIGVAG